MAKNKKNNLHFVKVLHPRSLEVKLLKLQYNSLRLIGKLSKVVKNIL
jgi:hypothetical protein